MKTYFARTILAVAVCALGASAQTPAGGPASAANSTLPYSQPDETKRAEAYSYFMMGHLAEREFETSGKTEYAQQAIEDYQKALEQDPNNLDAHRLLARIYIHELGDASASTTQNETIAAAVEQLEAVQRLDPADIESQLWLAHLYGFQNKPQKSEQELQNILNTSPGNESALEQLSQLYLEEGRAKDAIGLLQNAAASAGNPQIYDLLGQAYSKTHAYDKAESAFEQAVKLDPDEPSHREGLARAFLSNGNNSAALAQYQKLTQMEPDNAENYLRISQIYRHMNQLDQSEAALMQAKKYAPDNLDVLYNQALLYEAQARYKDAIELLSDTIAGVKAQQQDGQASPNALSILYEQLGMAHRDAGDYTSAEHTFEDMQKLGPESKKRGELLLIDTYRASGDIKDALAEAQKARSESGSDASLGVTYAMLLGDNGQTDDAAKVLRGLVGQSPRDTYLDLAQVEERGKRYNEAEKDASKALALSPDPSDKETAWLMLGNIYDDQKRYKEAEEMFRKSLAVNPNDAMALNDYGYMLVDRGVRLDEAVSLIHKAVNDDPTNGAYLDSLGWAYFKEGNLPEAQEYLQQAVAHDGSDPTVLGHLGDIYAKMGQNERAEQIWEKALACWQKALPADYQPSKVAELQSKLRNLKHRVAQRASGSGNPR